MMLVGYGSSEEGAYWCDTCAWHRFFDCCTGCPLLTGCAVLGSSAAGPCRHLLLLPCVSNSSTQPLMCPCHHAHLPACLPACPPARPPACREVKNSWSTHWGDGGYIKVARDNRGCGVPSDAVYAVVADGIQA